MASFLGLPPEIRQLIYDELLVEPIERRRFCLYTLDDASGESSWWRIAGRLPSLDDHIEDDEPVPAIKSLIRHLDYRDLWSLARANKSLYIEATPTIYSHAQLEYISGDTPTAHANPTLLHKYLEKVSPMTSTLYRNLTIVDGRKDMSGKDMKILVDLINLRLPNLRSLDIQGLDPGLESYRHVQYPGLLIDALQILAATRPLAHLTLWPDISIKPRLCFYSEEVIDFADDPHFAAIGEPWWDMI